MTRHGFAARFVGGGGASGTGVDGARWFRARGGCRRRNSRCRRLPNVADLADKLLPAVVEISVECKVAGSATPEMPQLPEDSPFKDFFDDFFKKRQGEGGGERTVNSMGSGFIIDASGIVVTNNHVVEGAESIEIRMQDGTTLKAELKGRDPKTDLAVLTGEGGQAAAHGDLWRQRPAAHR